MRTRPSKHPYLSLGVLWGIFFLGFSVRMAIIITMPLIREDLQISNTQVGLLLTITTIAYGLIQFLAGILTDKYDDKTLLLLITLFLALTMIGISVSLDILLLAACLLLMGTFIGFSSPVSFSIISHTFSERVGTVMGLYNSAPPFAQFFGTYISGILAVEFDWHWAYYVWIVLGLSLMLLVWRFIPPSSPNPDVQVIDRKTITNFVANKPLMLFLVTFIAHSVCAFSALTMNPLYLVDVHGLDVPMTATVYGSTRFIGFIGSFIGGFLADRVSKVRLLLASLTTTAICIYAFAVLPFSPLLIGVLCIQAVSINLFFPVIYALIIRLTTPTMRGKAQGLYNSVAFTIGGLAPYIIGVISDISSFTHAFMFPPIIAGVGILCTLIGMKKGFSDSLQ